MSNLRQVGLGILAALVSTIIVFGSILLALVEGGTPLALVPTSMDTPQIDTPEPGEPTATSLPIQPTDDSPTTICMDTPPGWIDYQIMPGESLASIANAIGIPLEALRSGNCLAGDSLIAGSVLSVPPKILEPSEVPTQTPPPPTATPIKTRLSKKTIALCSGPPKGWSEYKVKRGDNLFRIALAYDLTTTELVAANCLDTTLIRVGQIIHVPWYKAQTTKPTPTPRPTFPVQPPASTEPPTAPPIPPAPVDPPQPPAPPSPPLPPQPPDPPLPPVPSEPPVQPAPTQQQIESPTDLSTGHFSPECSKLIQTHSYL